MSKFLTKAIVLLSFVSLFTDIASEMLYPIMPIFLKSIGFSVVLIGILEGLAEATAGISKGYFGHLSDRLGKRTPFIRWGYTMSAFSKPMMAAFIYPVWIFFARTLDRLGKGIRNSARDALLSDESSPETKGKVFGFHRGMDTLGAAIGPFIALIFLFFYPGQYRWLFILAFIPGFIAIGLTWLIKEKKKPPKQVDSKEKSGFFNFIKYWRIANPQYKYLVVGLLIFALFNSSDVFLLLMVKHRGFSDTQMIGLYIFYNLLYALLSYPSGWLADKLGMKNVMIAGILVFASVYVLFGFATTLLHFAMLFGLYSFYAAATEGISKAWISNLAQKEHTATAIGFYNSFQSIAALLASSIAGLLWYGVGPMFMFTIAGIAAIIVSIYLFVVFNLRNSNYV
jgi:MFS family permease